MALRSTLLTTFILLVFVASLPFVLENKSHLSSTEQSRTFECGLDSLEITHFPFSLRFFCLVIVFIIFDVELVLLIPSVFLGQHRAVDFLTMFYTFILILLVGVGFELRAGALQ